MTELHHDERWLTRTSDWEMAIGVSHAVLLDEEQGWERTPGRHGIWHHPAKFKWMIGPMGLGDGKRDAVAVDWVMKRDHEHKQRLEAAQQQQQQQQQQQKLAAQKDAGMQSPSLGQLQRSASCSATEPVPISGDTRAGTPKSQASSLSSSIQYPGVHKSGKQGRQLQQARTLSMTSAGSSGGGDRRQSTASASSTHSLIKHFNKAGIEPPESPFWEDAILSPGSLSRSSTDPVNPQTGRRGSSASPIAIRGPPKLAPTPGYAAPMSPSLATPSSANSMAPPPAPTSRHWNPETQPRRRRSSTVSVTNQPAGSGYEYGAGDQAIHPQGPRSANDWLSFGHGSQEGYLTQQSQSPMIVAPDQQMVQQTPVTNYGNMPPHIPVPGQNSFMQGTLPQYAPHFMDYETQHTGSQVPTHPSDASGNLLEGYVPYAGDGSFVPATNSGPYYQTPSHMQRWVPGPETAYTDAGVFPERLPDEPLLSEEQGRDGVDSTPPASIAPTSYADAMYMPWGFGPQ